MSSVIKPADRRSLIGGSDSRIIMGEDEEARFGSGAKSAVRPNRRICPAILSCSWG